VGTARRFLRLAMAVAGAVSALAAGASGTAAGAEFGVTKWEAGTCTSKSCTDAGPASEFFTEAAGHPTYGMTDFRFASEESTGLAGKVYRPIGHVKNVRVDLPSGLAVNPEATPTCSEAQLEAKESKCPAASQVGEDEATGTVEAGEAVLKLLGLPKLGVGVLSTPITVTEKFPVYNLERLPGQAARFGVEVNSPTISLLKLKSVIYLEGALSWHAEAGAPNGESSDVATGDYHELFKILNIPTVPELVESKLIFWGSPHEFNAAAPEKAFITMPSTCDGPQTTLLHVDSYEDEAFLRYANPTPVGATGCDTLEFKPSIHQQPETTSSDAPDGAEVDVSVPQYTDEPGRRDSPELAEAKVTLPEGMTLDPSAANGLQACPDALFHMGSGAAIECPSKSILGTVEIDAPGIPNGSLTGHVYLGTPQSSEPASGQEYRLLVAAEAAAYDLGLRIEGHVQANPLTGRLTATFSDLPPVPFEVFKMKLDGGPTAPLANPLSCGPATASGELFPYSAEPPATPGDPFTVTALACPPSFAVAQSAVASSTKAGSGTNFTLGLTRPEGKQYISSLSTTLPAGMIGEIPAVPLCEEAQAAAQKCPAASQIGTASVTAGSGSAPLALPPGPVYLTGPYDGAPFGMEVLTDAGKVGPFDYGTIVTRAKVEIDPYTARVTVSAAVPTIVGGAPVRLRSLNVSIDHPAFMLNPTSCGPLATETSLVSTFGATDRVSTPFQASGCEALGFAPTFHVSTGAHHTRRFGARLTVSVAARPGDANIRSVKVMLPKKIVADTETLKYACPAATFQANPSSCPTQSRVGHAEVSTPALPGMLSGDAYFVSHGGAGFPNLDVVLNGDGVTIILVGDTNIKGRFTHSTFASLPDVPIKSFSLSLPTSSHPALDGYGNFCKSKLRMPITIVGQNGKSITQRPRIAVAGCKRKSAKHRKSKHRGRRRRATRR
jgi:hypothetical protein